MTISRILAERTLKPGDWISLAGVVVAVLVPALTPIGALLWANTVAIADLRRELAEYRAGSAARIDSITNHQIAPLERRVDRIEMKVFGISSADAARL